MQSQYQDSAIVSIDEVADHSNEWQKCLSSTEYATMSECKKPLHFLAKKLAAKLALKKGLTACGIYLDCLSDISVMNTEAGQPYFSFTQAITNQLAINNVSGISLSISDEHQFAFAYVNFLILRAV